MSQNSQDDIFEFISLDDSADEFVMIEGESELPSPQTIQNKLLNDLVIEDVPLPIPVLHVWQEKMLTLQKNLFANMFAEYVDPLFLAKEQALLQGNLAILQKINDWFLTHFENKKKSLHSRQWVQEQLQGIIKTKISGKQRDEYSDYCVSNQQTIDDLTTQLQLYETLNDRMKQIIQNFNAQLSFLAPGDEPAYLTEVRNVAASAQGFFSKQEVEKKDQDLRITRSMSVGNK